LIPKINWLVRIKNPVWLLQIFIAATSPVLAYYGISVQQLTSWDKFGVLCVEAVKNPYVLGLIIANVFNTVTDPTTKGISDSTQALSYNTPR